MTETVPMSRSMPLCTLHSVQPATQQRDCVVTASQAGTSIAKVFDYLILGDAYLRLVYGVLHPHLPCCLWRGGDGILVIGLGLKLILGHPHKPRRQYPTFSLELRDWTVSHDAAVRSDLLLEFISPLM